MTSERLGRARLDPDAPEPGNVRALPLAAPDDAALVRAVVRRHPGAARIVWDRFAPLVRGLLTRLIGPGGDSEDATQEVFLAFFKNAATLRDPSLLSSFVVGITVRVARAELRRRRVRRWLSFGSPVPEPAASATDFAAREVVRRLYAMLDRLSDRVRVVFVLRHFEGLELVEVADSAGCSLATAKRRLAESERLVASMARGDALVAAHLGLDGKEAP